ncbi:MAG: hypothetical protein JEZ04_11930 [Spirochaetales bacterium]|nr:hypothetical protein [Spirochaetales bacterium]
MIINKGKYKDLESIILENDLLRVTLVPSAGARTASMIYLPEREELLWQNPSPTHAMVKYTQPFPDGEGAGFDEMFPTINPCPYPDSPWKGIEMPDHGEVWALPWNCVIEPDCVRLDVHGVRLPYRLSKSVRLEGAVMKSVYRLENCSPFPMPFLYAAHPLFNVTAGDRIIVPDNLKSVINSVSSEALPEYGAEHEWTDALSVMPPENPTGFKKYYFTGKNTEGWSALRREELSLEIRMSCSAEELPYLGIWMNEGGWADQYNLALEPASAPMDDLPAARSFDAESVLGPNEVREWTLDISTATFCRGS